MATRTKLGRRQVEILEAMDTGLKLQMTGTGKKARIQFSGETEVPAPNANAVRIYHEREWIRSAKPKSGKPRVFSIAPAGKSALAANSEALATEVTEAS